MLSKEFVDSLQETNHGLGEQITGYQTNVLGVYSDVRKESLNCPILVYSVFNAVLMTVHVIIICYIYLWTSVISDIYKYYVTMTARADGEVSVM